jgi:hypothetical protein
VRCATALGLFLALPLLAQAADRDGDGLLDRDEKALGTDPSFAEKLTVLFDDGPESEERREKPDYDGTKDILTVACAHVAEDRFLWRAVFAQPPRPEDTVFHLYVDADATEATGRKGPDGGSFTGTDYMLTMAGGRAYSTHFAPDGSRIPGPPVTYVVHEKSLLMTADLGISRDADGPRFALYVLCHTRVKSGTRPPMSDRTGKELFTDVPLSTRRKIRRPEDYAANHNVDATFGLHRLRRIEQAEDTSVLRHDQFELDGFEIDRFTSRRWPHLKLTSSGATASAKAPEAGRYHVGFMMYDDERRTERIAIAIDGQLAGVAVANQDNNRTWLYWLAEARELKGGERITLRACGSGTHGIIKLLFLPRPPEPRSIRYAVENLTAVSPADPPRRAIASWTTTWPCPTRFEYGTDAGYGKMIEKETECLVHRVVLRDLDPETEYHGLAIGTTRDGEPFRSDDFTFRVQPPTSPPTTSGVHEVPLSVRNPHPFAVERWPVTTGVPFPQGVLASAEHVRLTDGKGEAPCQVRCAARWPDGSVKWLRITFLAAAPANGQSTYPLQYGRQVRRERANRKPAVTGGITTTAHVSGKPLKPTDAEQASVLDESGPLRAVRRTTSHLANGDGEDLLRVEQRIEAVRGLPVLRIQHTFTVTAPSTFLDLESLALRVPIEAKGAWTAARENGEAIRLDAGASVHQRFDDEFIVRDGAGPRVIEGRLRGSLIAQDAPCALAVRDAWQNYPKAFSLDEHGVRIGLCPPFDARLYDKFLFEKEGHHLYYYLRDGQYRLKRGMAKTHELLLCFEPDKEKREQLCSLFQRPLLATAPPEWYCDSKAFYDVAPRDPDRLALYEQGIEKNLEAYAQRRERQSDFGLMNYGDWYGERGANWGNIEYDTQHAFFLEYIRSGNPDAFFLGHATELHNRDVDTVHWHPDPSQVGLVYVHQMGHVGGYYDESVPGTLGIPRAGGHISHAWAEGHFDHYFLTGDRRSYDTGVAVADCFVRRELGRPYDFRVCRTPGWHLIMLMAAWHATGDPYYMNAAKVVAERVLETQDGTRPLPDDQREDRTPVQEGGWSRMMRPGHCRCTPRHRGNAGFMVAVLLSGLKYYHDATGDPRAKDAIIRGAHYLLDECYSPEVKGFRYTSCPETDYRPGATPLMVEGIARAYLWTQDQRFRRVLTEALPLRARGSPYGKGFSMYYRCGPRVMADLLAAGLTLKAK